MERLHAVIKGRVQGVGFRDATAREARRLGLGGWVRNRLEGTVEVLAEGPAEALRALETFLRQGPRMANVTGTDIFWEPAPGSSLAPTGMPSSSPSSAPPAAAPSRQQHADRDRLPSFEIR